MDEKQILKYVQSIIAETLRISPEEVKPGMALGNELGLILIMGKHTHAAFKKGRKREIYDTEIFLNFNRDKPALTFDNYPYIISAK